MVYKPTLKFPGTILHRKRGRIDLCKCSQEQLKELHEGGCIYIAALPGDPPCEKPIDVAETPSPKRVTKISKKSNAKQKAESEPEPVPQVKEAKVEPDDDSDYTTETEKENLL